MVYYNKWFTLCWGWQLKNLNYYLFNIQIKLQSAKEKYANVCLKNIDFLQNAVVQLQWMSRRYMEHPTWILRFETFSAISYDMILNYSLSKIDIGVIQNKNHDKKIHTWNFAHEFYKDFKLILPCQSNMIFRY